MYSIVIPTMWKCDRLTQTLNELNKLESVGEIILIDNTNNPYIVELDKVNHIKEGKNTFVNPAWNKGYHLSRFDKLLILNDDVWMRNWETLNGLDKIDLYQYGVIGMDIDGLTNPNFELGLLPTPQRRGAWGCMMIMDKRNYTPIPEEMKIWGGDDYLFVHNRAKWGANHTLVGVPLEGHISLTADEKNAELHRIMEEDLNIKHSLNLF
jgi:hypothetical protein